MALENRISLSGVYTKQPRIVDEALPHCTMRRVVIQAGAHIGVWPKRLSQEFDLVVAFEPRLDSWQAAMEATAGSGNVLLIHGALGTQPGFSRITGVECSGSARISSVNGDVTPMYTIDALPREIRSRVDAIFLDVEGYELEVIRGAAETIATNLPLLVVELESRFWLLEDLLALLPSNYASLGVFHRDVILKAQ